MKVLYLNCNAPDYLAESLFHGLRQLLGNDIVDIPRYDSMYADFPESEKKQLRGGGFTLYGQLEEKPELNRLRKEWKQNLNTYDIIVLANISRQFKLFSDVVTMRPKGKIVVLDGADSPSLFPFTSIIHRVKKEIPTFFLSFKNVKYFKREFDRKRSLWNGADAYIPEKVINWVVSKRDIKPISFSIPLEKIAAYNKSFANKKPFPVHIVDKEVADHVDNSFFSSTGSDQYTFESEAGYYNDLQNSKFGITTKRAGWDCLRHYELAANGCVLCFRDLNLKPPECAPFGLDESNCIIYNNFPDLMQKLSAIDEAAYNQLQSRSMQWVHSMSTVNVAKRFLENCIS